MNACAMPWMFCAILSHNHFVSTGYQCYTASQVIPRRIHIGVPQPPIDLLKHIIQFFRVDHSAAVRIVQVEGEDHQCGLAQSAVVPQRQDELSQVDLT